MPKRNQKIHALFFQNMAQQIPTLKACQADGMYYPPEWRPEHGDLDTFHGGHKLRDQAKKISQVTYFGLVTYVNLTRISRAF